MTGTVNRYASQELFIARVHHKSLLEFVSRSEQDSHPFARQVDAWWAAIAIGVQQGQRTAHAADRVKFNDGGILSSDPWRITHLELLALAEGGPEILDKPAEVIRMASEYANTGFPRLLDHLMGEPEPTLNLMMRLLGEAATLSEPDVNA